MHYTHGWRAEDNFVELVLSFHLHGSPRDSNSEDETCIFWQKMLCPLSLPYEILMEDLPSVLVINLQSDE